jgi:ketosteroid isomerase-like protein
VAKAFAFLAALACFACSKIEPGEETMKMRLVVAIAIVGLTMGFGLPSIAQDKNTVDPQVRQQIEAVSMKFQEAYNNRDIAAIAALQTQNAVELRSWQGLASGREAIVQRFAADFGANLGKKVNTITGLYPIGNAICQIADSQVGEWKAQTVTIYVLDGGTWKNSMTYVNNMPQR